jgi:hypothetical protein
MLHSHLTRQNLLSERSKFMQKQHHFSSTVSLWFFIFTVASIFLAILKPHEVKANSIGCTAAPGSIGSEVCLEIR